jgi:hypothetical protein
MISFLVVVLPFSAVKSHEPLQMQMCVTEYETRLNTQPQIILQMLKFFSMQILRI